MKKLTTLAALSILGCMVSGTSFGAETTIKMLNKGTDGVMVFEPAFVHIAVGDTIHFSSVDKGHNIESIPGMIPDGATPISGKMSEDVSVKFDKQGVYGVRCKPHSVLGMVALIEVGAPVNEAAAKAVVNIGKAKDQFTKLFAALDAQNSVKK